MLFSWPQLSLRHLQPQQSNWPPSLEVQEVFIINFEVPYFKTQQPLSPQEQNRARQGNTAFWNNKVCTFLGTAKRRNNYKTRHRRWHPVPLLSTTVHSVPQSLCVRPKMPPKVAPYTQCAPKLYIPSTIKTQLNVFVFVKYPTSNLEFLYIAMQCNAL